MKLRNKKTGEHGEYQVISDGYLIRVRNCDTNESYQYDSIAGFNDNWEDYKPKLFWLIGQDGNISSDNDSITQDYADRLKAIGNYFDSKEEAEEAVEKLEAWKRLKDKGLRFKGWYGDSKNINWEITSLKNEAYIPRQIGEDLSLLFGDEE